ncbi:CBS domain-containing protein [Tropicibacter sp. S64]|uniref:CBS domain-containing protein n=1 Tax=Tropicibacter sp. S64 TaxID=3415122 RepID=UPI003C7A0D71
MLAHDIMTSPVVKIQHDATINEAIALMVRHDIGFLPLVRDGWLCGVVTDRDILIRGMRGGGLEPFDPIKSLATQKAHQATPNTPLDEIVGMMASYSLRRVPVCDSLGYLVGVISLTDIARLDSGERAAQILRGPQKPACGLRSV